MGVANEKHSRYLEDVIRSISFGDWTNIFLRNNIIYITGGAGYGKSLLLKNIIINYEQLNITGSRDHIVIYGEIKWFIKPDGSFKSMTEFIEECIVNSTLSDFDKDFVEYFLDQGRCILLLDALDEVPMNPRKDLHRTIIAHVKTLNPNNKICITSRDRGFIPVKEEIEHFSIQPLDEPQIKDYVDKIIKLRKFSENDKQPFMNQAKNLVEKGFLNSFLILSLLINIYKGERELPETKLELYQKCLEYISNKREKPKSDSFNWNLIAPLIKDNTFIELSLLCFPNNKEVSRQLIIEKLTDVYKRTFKDEATLYNAISEFLEFCSERTELFVPATMEDNFKFFHRSFFEYFYSKNIVIRCKTVVEMYDELKCFDVDSEIFELTLSRLKQETQDKYIELVDYAFELSQNELRENNTKYKDLNILILFMQVIDEVTYQKQFVELIIEYAKNIGKGIRLINNQETILNVIVQTNEIDSIKKAYENFVIRDITNPLKDLNIFDLKSLLDVKNKDESEKNTISFMRYFVPRSSRNKLEFYTIIYLKNTTLFKFLNEVYITNTKFSPNKRDKHIVALIEYYNNLNSEDQVFLDKFFER